ncbi:hypothetical protein CHU92_13595 [Flavobacterium cyanobacteriorum]|uniref:N-acetyltransferase domain-containing protein n=1 Tax=Flavobacterium cyanobacteriorum TaxID=2022802 RepID=A0A255YVA2_9FLAO|nr:GNAT family N-acetyltransferase [Flavobacterium cyanobacteriorum]OYQ33167.1 hypothetical protein CHU92_13595 [Flavobacterium cyanobacteriorum]
MEIGTLAGVPLAAIAEVFNEAFSDYKIKFNVNEHFLLTKFAAENIKPEASAGAFVGGRLVGFLLHGLDQTGGIKYVFNAGTGVVPPYRGQQIAQKMYTYILPLLKEQGYRHHQLEVLNDNLPAIHIYKNMGFTAVREIASFKGIPQVAGIHNVAVKEVGGTDWDFVATCATVQPTWQNNWQCIERAKGRHRFFEAYAGDERTGFAIYDTFNGRTKQFGVKPEWRRKGVGSAIFGHLATLGEINFVNYDLSDKGGVNFFRKIGLEEYFGQYEMKMYY